MSGATIVAYWRFAPGTARAFIEQTHSHLGDDSPDGSLLLHDGEDVSRAVYWLRDRLGVRAAVHPNWEEWSWGELEVINPQPPQRYVDGERVDLLEWREAARAAVGLTPQVMERLTAQPPWGPRLLRLVSDAIDDACSVETLPRLAELVREMGGDEW